MLTGMHWCAKNMNMEIKLRKELEVEDKEFEGWVQGGDSISTMKQNILSRINDGGRYKVFQIK